MASKYPAALDTLRTDYDDESVSEESQDDHPGAHNDVNAAVLAIEATLGVKPQGASATVAQALASKAAVGEDGTVGGPGGSPLSPSVVTDSLTEAEAMGVIVHAAEAGKARGTKFAQYTWIGSVEPTHMADGDIWIETA